MPCDFPLKAFRSTIKGSTGKPLVTFNPMKAINSTSPFELPCGRCTGCRLERSRQWAIRCEHESQLWPQNAFITLTFSNENLPADYSVHVRTMQLFIKKLRKSLPYKKIRFLACGEYGDLNLRPHYHAIIFNHDFNDKILYQTTPSGEKLYTSTQLSKIWSYGLATTGSVTFESAAYVARYVMKKYTGPSAEEHYTRRHPLTGDLVTVQPEFLVMSRKPGLGARWIEKYKSDVYPGDFIVSRGVRMASIRFYDQQLTEEELSNFKRRRKSRSLGQRANGTKERRAVRAIVRDSKIKNLKRKLED